MISPRPDTLDIRIAADLSPGQPPDRRVEVQSAAQTPLHVFELRSTAPVRRVMIVLAAVSLFSVLNQAWGQIISFPAAGLASVLLVAAVLGLVVLALKAASDAELARLEQWLLVLAVLALVVDAAALMYAAQGYGTDEGALQQGAALALLHGHDPYGANLSSALYGWTSSSLWYTFQLNGHIVSSYGYPALPLLIVTPFVELTHGGQGVSIAYLLVLIATLVLMFRRLPAPYKPISVIVCCAFSNMLSGALAGETELLAMLPMLYVASGWTQIGATGRLQRPGRLSAFALGLAIASSPVAWFMGAFVVVGVCLINAGRLGWSQAARLTLRYGGLAGLAFLAVNLPFILWGPASWVRGVTATVTQHAVPLGQGVISLTMFAHLGGGNLSAFNDAAMAGFAAAMVLYTLYFRRLGSAGFVLALVGLFLATRSLAGYWMFAVAVIVVAAACDDRSAFAAAPDLAARIAPGIRRLMVPAALLPATAFIVLALTASAPLRVAIVAAPQPANQQGVARITLAVTNHSASALSPVFTVAMGDRSTPIWTTLSGPQSLGPGAQARYVIRAPDGPSEPSSEIPYVVEAETAAPETISSSVTVSDGDQTSHLSP